MSLRYTLQKSIDRIMNTPELLYEWFGFGVYGLFLLGYLHSTKKVSSAAVLMIFFFYMANKYRLKAKIIEKNKFNDAISKEVLSIKFRLNELQDHNKPCFPKYDRLPDELERKNFTKYWLAYHQYQDIAQLESYKLSEDKYGAMIILLQTNEKKYYDPFSDANVDFFGEEELIKLHSSGHPEYHQIKKLNIGDTIKAYVYDMDYWGFLEPSESEIKVVSIENAESDYASRRHITFEIDRKWTGSEFSGKKSGEPITRTIKYLNL